MKKILLALAFVVHIYAAGIPVVDAAANSQLVAQGLKQVEEMVNTAKRWTDTVAHYKQQIDHYTKDFIAKTGIKDVVAVIKEAKGIYDDMKGFTQDAQSIISGLSGDSNALSNKAKSLMSSFLPNDFCGDTKAIGYEVCQNQTIGAFEDIIFFTQIGENVTNELKNLNELVGKLKASQDIKESADTQAAINSKIASLQAQKIQLDLYEAQRNKREELINMQKKAEAKKAWTTPSYLKF